MSARLLPVLALVVTSGPGMAQDPPAATDLTASDDAPAELELPPGDDDAAGVGHGEDEAEAGWYLVPKLRATPGAKIIDAIGAGPHVYVLDDKGILYTSKDYGASFAARELAIAQHGIRRRPALSYEIPKLWPGLTKAGSNNFVGGMGLYLLLGSREHLRWNISDAFSFPYGTTGEPYLELSPDSPAFNGGIWVPGVPRPGAWNFYDEPTNVNDAYWGASRLLQQTGRGAVRSHQVSVDLDEPSRVAVAGDGLILVSRDGGLTFDELRESPPFTCCDSLVFAGNTLVGTTGRTLIVRSEGIGDPLLPGAVVPLVEYAVRDKGDPDHLLFVAEQELLESFDGGSSVRRVFVARASRINHVAIEPSSGRVYVATMTGLFVRDAQSTEFVDTGISGPIHSVEINPVNPSEVLLNKFRALLKSNDAGETFQEFTELDGRAVAMLDPIPERGWILVTERGVYQLQRTPPGDVDAGRLAVARYLLRQQPSAAEAMQAAYDLYVPEPPLRSFFDQALPRMSFMVGVAGGPQFAGLDYVPLTTLSGDTRARDTLDRAGTQVGQNALLTRDRDLFEPFAVAMLSWDLPGLVGPPHHPERDRIAALRSRELQDLISRLHSLRTRLLVERIIKPPADHASVLDLELRIEEVNEQLKAITGVAYSVPDFAKEVDQYERPDIVRGPLFPTPNEDSTEDPVSDEHRALVRSAFRRAALGHLLDRHERAGANR